MLRLFFCLLLLMPIAASAHEGHGTEGNPFAEQRIPIGVEQAREYSWFILKRLIERGKLDFSWEEAEIISVDKIKFKKATEWEVIYENVEEGDPSKQKLYIFLSIYGEYSGANFTGQ